MASRNDDWKEIWERKGADASRALHEIDGYDLLTSEEWIRMVATLMSPIPLPADTAVAELGCGAGAFVAALRAIEPGVDITGLDYAPNLVEIARHRVTGRARFFVDDIRVCSTLADASADVVCSFGVLLYLDSEDDVRRALRQADRVARPGGHFFIGEISDLARRDLALAQRQTTHAGHQRVSDKDVDHLYLPRELFLDEAARLGWRDLSIVDHADLPALSNNPLAAYRYSLYARKPRRASGGTA